MRRLLICYRYVTAFGDAKFETRIITWTPQVKDAAFDAILFFNYIESQTPKGAVVLNIIDLTAFGKDLSSAKGDVRTKYVLIYEDELPADIAIEDYTLWYMHSILIDGVRMGYRLEWVKENFGI